MKYKNIFAYTALVFAALLAACQFTIRIPKEQRPYIHTQYTSEIISRSLGAVVDVYAECEDNGKTTTSHGSGVFIAKIGIVLTAKHVIDPGTCIVYAFPLEKIHRDRRIMEGDVVTLRVRYRDDKYDVALLELADKSVLYIPKKVATIDPVIYPKSDDKIFTIGITSVFQESRVIRREGNILVIDRAEIDHGDSGGPAFDINGNVIGVISYIVPSNNEAHITMLGPITAELLTLYSEPKNGVQLATR
jgi:S1-C subfamily serine protease